MRRSRADSYPRPHRRGPIEARLWLLKLIVLDVYPRPHRRGPIEARFDVWQRVEELTIRVLTGAAPLKHASTPESSDDPADYPRPHRRGPIEAQDCKTPLGAQEGYPRPHRRGPIEAVTWRTA